MSSPVPLSEPQRESPAAAEGQPPPLLRVAVVGCGAWGRNLARNFAELGALAAVVDPDEAAIRPLIAAHGLGARSLEGLLADPAIDAVAIAAPSALHYALARRALEAGKHVFVEKPLALQLHEAEELCRLAERLDRRLMVGHLMQYHPAFLGLRALLRDGRLGSIQYIYS